MKKIVYEEPVGKLRELDDLYISKMKEALKERNIYGILFYDNSPHYHPSGVYYDENDPEFLSYMLKFEQDKIYLALYDEDRSLNSDKAVCFTKEQYEQGILAELDQDWESDWAEYFADEDAWTQVEDLMEEHDEFNFSGGRAYLYDDIYEHICETINEFVDNSEEDEE